MDSVTQFVHNFTKPLEKYLRIVSNTISTVPAVHNALEQLEEKVKMAREHIIGFAVLLLGVVFWLFVGLRGVGYLVGFVIPTYESWRAIKTDELNDDRKWLVYWVIYSFITTVEGISDILLSWIPFYEVAKIILFIALWHPTTEGAEWLFQFSNSTMKRMNGGNQRRENTEGDNQDNDEYKQN